jgi:formylglycine-generating enzyme required for sulfatase activity
MVGNVGEWCNDWYGSDYYSISPTENPRGPASGTHRIYRGGAWLEDAWMVRCAFRRAHEPIQPRDSNGFRIAAGAGVYAAQ